MIDVEKVLQKLKEERKYFHNESDLQFHFSWYCKLLYPHINIRLEYPFSGIEEQKNSNIDLITFDDKEAWLFEFKFKTKASYYYDDKLKEEFQNKDHGAQNINVVLIHHDIARIENSIDKSKYISKRKVTKGFCIFLTNDKKYKKGFSKNSSVFKYGLNFPIIKKGKLNFTFSNDKKKEKSHLKKYNEIVHTKELKIKWSKYHEYDMMIVEIK
ncbi:hypothetical protein [Malacoplasma iowae]|uniref:Uncharacterized protein n=1 Tax=Malacoplasma iowae 695 TaxID=1048830 RepID=A0A6P1LCR6_MALIO|nr:hypothetical protein [Malacoplasma iowae]VEU62888.1 Uncharacterised protein [Mycoplasmopsis fermentans]EGZ31714.1 hypothetical protein GUU_00437 [Malacoplasma iowae 695]QHG89434.1 hypothetical protein EER00_00785 [Malacoplasma iowae 695]WPL35845.1 hypothetical protein QX180_00265 [Malacoplasma iowae]VEU71641.1 Uncharacterised protein [Malacoplasma iowae]